MYERLRCLLTIIMVIHESVCQRYYYRNYGERFDIYYGPYALRGYQELKAPKSYKDGYDDRGDRPGSCDNGRFLCTEKQYPIRETIHFECLKDYQCPHFHKCCQPGCFQHKICQPAIYDDSSTELTSEVPLEKVSPTAMHKSTERYFSTQIRTSITSQKTISTSEPFSTGTSVENLPEELLSTSVPEKISSKQTTLPTTLGTEKISSISIKTTKTTMEDDEDFTEGSADGDDYFSLLEKESSTDSTKPTVTEISSTVPSRTAQTTRQRVTSTEKASPKSITNSERRSSTKPIISNNDISMSTTTITIEDDEDFTESSGEGEDYFSLLEKLTTENSNKVTTNSYSKITPADTSKFPLETNSKSSKFTKTTTKKIATSVSTSKTVVIEDDEDFTESSGEGEDYYSLLEKLTTENSDKVTTNSYSKITPVGTSKFTETTTKKSATSVSTSKTVATIEDDEDFVESSGDGEDYFSLLEELSSTKTSAGEVGTQRPILTPSKTEDKDYDKATGERYTTTAGKETNDKFTTASNPKILSSSIGTTTIALTDDDDFIDGSGETSEVTEVTKETEESNNKKSSPTPQRLTTQTGDTSFKENNENNESTDIFFDEGEGITGSDQKVTKTNIENKDSSTGRQNEKMELTLVTELPLITKESHNYFSSTSISKEGSESDKSDEESHSLDQNVLNDIIEASLPLSLNNTLYLTNRSEVNEISQLPTDFTEFIESSSEDNSLESLNRTITTRIMRSSEYSTPNVSESSTQVPTIGEYTEDTSTTSVEQKITVVSSTGTPTTSKIEEATKSSFGKITETPSTVVNTKESSFLGYEYLTSSTNKEASHSTVVQFTTGTTDNTNKKEIYSSSSVTATQDINRSTAVNTYQPPSTINIGSSTGINQTDSTSDSYYSSTTKKEREITESLLHGDILNNIIKESLPLSFLNDSDIEHPLEHDKNGPAQAYDVDILSSDNLVTAACHIEEARIPKSDKKESQANESDSDKQNSLKEFDEIKEDIKGDKPAKEIGNQYNELSKNVTDNDHKYSSDDEDDKMESSGEYYGSGNDDNNILS